MAVVITPVAHRGKHCDNPECMREAVFYLSVLSKEPYILQLCQLDLGTFIERLRSLGPDAAGNRFRRRYVE